MGGRRWVRRGRWSGVRSPRELHLRRCKVRYSVSDGRTVRTVRHAEWRGCCGRFGNLVSMCGPFGWLTLFGFYCISRWDPNLPAR